VFVQEALFGHPNDRTHPGGAVMGRDAGEGVIDAGTAFLVTQHVRL